MFQRLSLSFLICLSACAAPLVLLRTEKINPDNAELMPTSVAEKLLADKDIRIAADRTVELKQRPGPGPQICATSGYRIHISKLVSAGITEFRDGQFGLLVNPIEQRVTGCSHAITIWSYSRDNLIKIIDALNASGAAITTVQVYRNNT